MQIYSRISSSLDKYILYLLVKHVIYSNKSRMQEWNNNRSTDACCISPMLRWDWKGYIWYIFYQVLVLENGIIPLHTIPCDRALRCRLFT